MMDDNGEIQQTLRNRVARLVRQARGSRLLREFSEQVGFSVSYLSDIERGRTIPTLETLEQIATRSGAVLNLEFVFDVVPPEYVTIRRVELEEMLKAVDRFRYVYATIDYLIKPEYTPASILPTESEA